MGTILGAGGKVTNHHVGLLPVKVGRSGSDWERRISSPHFSSFPRKVLISISP
jgi:hypothetical protein